MTTSIGTRHERLLTKSGDFVTRVDVPPYDPPPEIIAWGTRFFVRQQNGEYREGLVWASNDEPVADVI